MLGAVLCLVAMVGACTEDEPPAAPPPRAAEPAEPAEPAEMTPEEALAAYERWRAIPPPVEAATFDPADFEWRVVPGMESLAREGAEHVTIVARTGGGGEGCSGGMCSTALHARALRGTLPPGHIGYFATMRPPNEHLCEGGSDHALFHDWAVVEIAPRADDDRPLHCGISSAEGGDWVILRVGAPK